MTDAEKRERHRACARRYYERHREEVNAKRRARLRMLTDEEREARKAKNREWYRMLTDEEREARKAKNREWYRAHADKVRECARKYYLAHREHYAAIRNTPEYRAHAEEVRKSRGIRIVSENLARVKQSLIDNKEANEMRAKQVDIVKGLACMGDFVPRHKKFRDPND